MRLIESKAELLQQEDGLTGLYKHIELCGRTCYKSTDKMTEDSAKPFVDRMIASNHTAMLEHGTVYLKLSSRVGGSKYKDNKYSKAIFNTKDKGWYITTNLRVLVENGWLKDLRYLCTPTELHAKRYTFRVITSIGVTREFNRHRVNSIAEQSTRYCNFTKDKFDNEIKFIRPVWMNLNLGIYTIEPNEEHLGDVVGDGYIKPLSDRDPDNLFITHCLFAEDAYEDFINAGWQPQQAREVLPLCTATEACYTAFEEDWKNFADLRLRGTTGKPHPNMQHLAELMQKECLANHIMEDIWKD